MLGFVAPGDPGPTQGTPDSELAVLSPGPVPASPDRDEGGAPSTSGTGDGDAPKSLGLVYLGYGALGLAPANPVVPPGTPSNEASPAFDDASGSEISFGADWIIRGGERIGGSFGLSLGVQRGEVDAQRGNQAEKYSVFGAPFRVGGGLDVHVVRFLDLGPRLALQVGPYTLKEDATSASATAGSSSSGNGTSTFAFYYEYGAMARFRFATVALEPGIAWRTSSAVKSQVFTFRAMWGIGNFFLLGWWESRASTDGNPDSSGNPSAIFAGGMPEDSRLGIGAGIAIL